MWTAAQKGIDVQTGGYCSIGVCITTWWLALAELVFDVTGKVCALDLCYSNCFCKLHLHMLVQCYLNILCASQMITGPNLAVSPVVYCMLLATLKLVTSFNDTIMWMSVQLLTHLSNVGRTYVIWPLELAVKCSLLLATCARSF